MNTFHWSVEVVDDDEVLLVLEGAISEASDFTPLLERARPKTRLDLAGVERINSSGVREWVRFINQLCANRDVTLERCAVALVHQINMIANMTGTAHIASILLPYYCARGDRVRHVLHQTSAGLPDTTKSLSCVDAVEPRCAECPGQMEFDDLASSYFAFLDLRSKKEV